MRSRSWMRFAWVALAVGMAGSGSRAEVLERLVGRAGGLRADEVAARAVATSADVRRHQAEIAEATAQLDRALIAFFPRLAGSAQYSRLSAIETASIAGVSLPSLRNQTVLEQSL